MSSLKVVLFTIDDTHYIPSLIEPLLASSSLDIQHIYISKTIFSFSKMKKKFKFFAKNYYPFCIRFADILRFTLMSLNGFCRQLFLFNGSLLNWLKAQNVECSYLEKLNSACTHAELSKYDADVFLFCIFDKIAKPDIFLIPKLGTFNLHLGRLPSYKGGLSSFWVLRHSEANAGSSIHRVVEGIDEGRLVAEMSFPIKTNSMQKLLMETVDRSRPLLLDFFAKLASSQLSCLDTEGRPSGYYIYPDLNDIRQFYKNGCRLV